MSAQKRTIVAIATPSGEGALGVIRLSGDDALSIARQLAELPDEPESHRVYVRRLVEGDEVLDEAVILYFRAPRSFTGETVIELQCHGGRITLQRVLDACLRAGARLAEAGEFSRRALENGRLDLVQVEAIADVIHAQSESAQRLALQHLAGRLSREIDVLKAKLFELVTLVEAAIDFSLEEDVYTISPEEISEALRPIVSGTITLLGTYDAGRMRNDGIRLAIVGPPNAGKSSLLNHLLGEERALVTDIEGTTRDYLEESCRIGNLDFRLIDTAGIRATDDRVEAMGVERARALAREADVVLVVSDAARPEQEAELVEELDVSSVALLRNKVDLVAEPPPAHSSFPSVSVSLKTGSGLESLPGFFAEAAERAGYRVGAGTVLISRARHREALEDALSHLQRAEHAAHAGLDHTFIAQDLRAGLDALGTLTGAITADDILNRIFGDFCIGK